MPATACTSSRITVSTPRQRVAGGGGQHQEQRLGGGDQDVRRPGGQRAALGRRGVAGADADPHLRLGQPQPHRLLPDAGQRTAQIALHVDREGLERGHVQHAAALLRVGRRRACDASRSSAARNAASVLPEPVGATTSTSEPSPMARHAPACAAVGAVNAPVNQRAGRGGEARRALMCGPDHAPIVHPPTDNGPDLRGHRVRARTAGGRGGAGRARRPRACADAWRRVTRDARMGARHWQYAELPGVDLLRARYVRHTFPRHTHDGLRHRARSPSGVEDVPATAAPCTRGPGTVVLINPETPHTGARRGARGLGVPHALPRPPISSRRSPPRPRTLRGTPGFTATGRRRPARGPA